MANTTLQTIKDGLGNLVTLDILTAVGNFQLGPDMRTIVPESLEECAKIVSRIGMLDGDIQTAASAVFVTNADYKDMWNFHQQQVQNGHDIINKNIEALSKLVTFIRDEMETGTKG